ncbi:MAG TPA: hypothetical protein VGO51_05720 [Burkholderiaceae bacterium]|nr:hypothetical protein [Burkholderiaceae bacterium]
MGVLPVVPELELPVEPEVPELLEELGALGSTEVPAVPLDPGSLSVPGAWYVPEVVGEPLVPLLPDMPDPELPDDGLAEPDAEPEADPIPDDEPEVDPIPRSPVELQAASTATHAKGIIHLFIESSLKR